MHLEHVTLPKGTYVKLKPDADNEFLRWSNPKAVFETALRRFATLTLGSTICLPHNGQDYRFTVTELKPSETVGILNTDIEVDFDASLLPPSAPSLEDMAKNLVIDDTGLEPAGVASPPGRRKKEEPEKEATGSFVAFGGSGHSLSSGDCSPAKAAESKKEEPESSGSASQKTSGRGRPLGGSLAAPAKVEEEPLEEGFVRCPLCRRGVPEMNMGRHEVFCARNNARCEHCGDVMAKNKLDAHVEEKHRMVACPQCEEQVENGVLEEHMQTSCLVPCTNCGERVAKGRMEEHLESECVGACQNCGEQVQMSAMAKHLDEACSRRPVRCEFCELSFPADSIMEHGDMCGARTEKCTKCDRWVMLKHLSVHEALDCELDPSSDMGSSPDLRASAPQEFCQYCNQPCYSIDQLQEHLSSQLGVLLTLVASGLGDGLARNQFGEVLMHQEVIKSDWAASPETASQVVAGIIASCKHASVVNSLLDAQLIDLDTEYLGKPLLLHFITRGCPAAVVDVLLAHRPDWGARDSAGKGILHTAISDDVSAETLAAIVRQLPLEVLARAIAPDAVGVTPLGLALSSSLYQHALPLLLYGGYKAEEVAMLSADRRQWIGLKKALVLCLHKLYFGVGMEEAEQRVRAADLKTLLCALSSCQLGEVNDSLLDMIRRASSEGRASVAVTAMPQRFAMSNNTGKATVQVVNCGSRAVQVWADDSALPVSLKLPGDIGCVSGALVLLMTNADYDRTDMRPFWWRRQAPRWALR